MKVLHLSVLDASGGAARAATRLHRALRDRGVDSRMLVRHATTGDPTVLEPLSPGRRFLAVNRGYFDQAVLLPYRRRSGSTFSSALLPDALAPDVAAVAPDVVHLHWVGDGFVRPATLCALGRPIVWTLHDAQPFTGGCHLPGACDRFSARCGRCPVLGSRHDLDLSRLNWLLKDRAWRGLPLTLVAPSRWMADRARRSALFRDRRVEVIPNGVDLALFRPIARHDARRMLALPPDRKLLLFSAKGGGDDPNKGWTLLVEALAALPRAGAAGAGAIELIVAGSSTPPRPAPPIPVHAMGVLSDERTVALVNAAADAVVIPSREENLPNAALEALACGRPVVAFRVGGLPEIVRERETGALADPYDPRDLAAAIGWVVGDDARWESLSRRARSDAEARFTASEQARRIAALYDATAAARVRDAAAPGRGAPAGRLA